MINAFEEFWENNGQGDKAFAEKLWSKAQKVAMNHILNPPFVPKIGDKIQICSLCHPNLIGKDLEVTDIEKSNIAVYWITTQYDNGHSTSGILGEAVKVNANR